MTKTFNIAIIGSRGIPGNYGGFETFAEKLSLGLVAKGHQVTVYCSSAYSKTDAKSYQGIRRVIVPNIKVKALDKLLTSFFSVLHASFCRYQVILILGVSPVIFAILPRVLGKRTVINIDGLEWRRKKWGRAGRTFLKFSEALSGKVCHEVVTDSMAIEEYFYRTYGKKSHYIAYGADIGSYPDHQILAKYGLTPKSYFLQVCRIEPENNVHVVIREFEQASTDKRLVILGDAPYSDEYIRSLKKTKDPRIVFLGGVYGHDYKVIQSNAYCYIHAHEVGGTNPALLEALAVGNCVVVLDVPYNLEVIAGAGLSFSRDVNDLAKKLEYLDQHPHIVADYRKKATNRIREAYTWDRIIGQYEALFTQVLKTKAKDKRLKA